MERLLDSLRQAVNADLNELIALAPRATAALIVLLIAVVIGRLVSAGVARVLSRGRLSPIHLTFFRRVVLWTFVLLGLVTGMNLVGLGAVAGGLLAGGGVVAVVLGFAFKEIGENLLAGIFLAFSRPFEVGDLIECNGFQGAVRSIDLRTTHIRSGDGRDIYIPNAQIFNQPLVNFTLDGLRQPRFRVGVDYGDDIGAACELLCATAAALDPVLVEPAPTARLVELDAGFVIVEVAFWIDVDDQSSQVPGVRSVVMEACRVALREGGFTLSNDCTTSVTFPAGVDVRQAA